ncbi:MAG: DNA polymerase I, partial [Alistipes sp.]|nr:DNA polymerase I [Alistipes sp.]
ELNFSSFLRELESAEPIEVSIPEQAPQQQLATVARQKSEAKRRAALEGQGDLFAMFTEPKSESVEEKMPAEEQSGAVGGDIATTPHDYRTITSEQELRDMCDYLRGFKEFAVDTETTGVNPIECKIVGMSFAAEPFKAWYLPLNVGGAERYIDIVRPLLEDSTIAKIGQNIKFDIMVMRKVGIELRGAKYDTMLLHYLIDSEARHNMDFIAEQYLGYTPISIETLIGKGAKQLTMDMISVERVAEYAAEDADVTLRLKDKLYREVERLGMAELYHRIEEPMIDVLADMEFAGVRIDSEALARYGVELNSHLSRLEQEICDLAGEPELNINSSRQLGEVLFGKLRITDKPKMTKTKQYSTEEEYLQGFAKEFPIVSKVLEYRGVKKLLSTYVEALPKLVNEETGRIHTSYNQAVTATGRLSSTNPNLQNIPIRHELGKPIRAAFIASEGNIIVAEDYSQIELRLMAHLSGDKALIDAFLGGEDIHSATAAHLYGKSPSEVTADERRRAKTANFGIIYGISA